MEVASVPANEASPLPSVPGGLDRVRERCLVGYDLRLMKSNTTDRHAARRAVGKELQVRGGRQNASATMSYRGKVTREIDQRISLKDFTDDYYILDFKNFGKFTANFRLRKRAIVRNSQSVQSA